LREWARAQARDNMQFVNTTAALPQRTLGL
jgi:hypothetical protein